MLCKIPEISWHNREPVLSVNVHPMGEKIYRLATSGSDTQIVLWRITFDDLLMSNTCIAELTHHQRSVNIVRWSPCGRFLASADDDAIIVIWHQKKEVSTWGTIQEPWVVYKVLRGHMDDVADLCWSPSDLKLISGSVDNTAIIWNVLTGQSEQILDYHNGFVQGVSWSPKNDVVATISTDRTLRVYSIEGQLKYKINKGEVPVPHFHYLYNKEVKYFHNDTYRSFYRRMQFSPDGSVLLVPSAYLESADDIPSLHATLGFSTNDITSPSVILPHEGCSTCVRFCPILFELRKDGPAPYINAPYRMVFSISIGLDVAFYDTQQPQPFAKLVGFHYTLLTDMAWSSDGLLFCASSSDGYCSVVNFDEGELGVPYNKEQVLTTEEREIENDGNERNNVESTFLERWAQTANTATTTSTSTSVGSGRELVENEENNTIVIDDLNSNQMFTKNNTTEIRPIAVRRVPRVTPAVQQVISGENNSTSEHSLDVLGSNLSTKMPNLIPEEVSTEKNIQTDDKVSNESVLSTTNSNKAQGTKMIARRKIASMRPRSSKVVGEESLISDENSPRDSNITASTSNKKQIQSTKVTRNSKKKSAGPVRRRIQTARKVAKSDKNVIIISSDEKVSSDENLPSLDENITAPVNIKQQIPVTKETGYPERTSADLLRRRIKPAQKVAKSNENVIIISSDEKISSDENLRSQDENIPATMNISKEIRVTKVTSDPKETSADPSPQSVETVDKVAAPHQDIEKSNDETTSSDENFPSRRENITATTNSDRVVQGTEVNLYPKKTSTALKLRNAKTVRKVIPNKKVKIPGDTCKETSDEKMTSKHESSPLPLLKNVKNIDSKAKRNRPQKNTAAVQTLPTQVVKKVNTLGKTKPRIKITKRKRIATSNVEPSCSSKRPCVAIVDLTLSDQASDGEEDTSDKCLDHDQGTAHPALVSQPRAHRVPLVTLASPKRKADKRERSDGNQHL